MIHRLIHISTEFTERKGSTKRKRTTTNMLSHKNIQQKKEGNMVKVKQGRGRPRKDLGDTSMKLLNILDSFGPDEQKYLVGCRKALEKKILLIDKTLQIFTCEK